MASESTPTAVLPMDDMATKVASAVADSLETVLQESVADLPLMASSDASRRSSTSSSNNHRPTRLLERLRDTYHVNIDAFEYVIQHSVFGLLMYPPNRRTTIAALWNDPNWTASLEAMTMNDNNESNKEDSTTSPSSLQYPDPSQVPTVEEVTALQAETAALRQQVAETRQRHAQALQALQELEHVAKSQPVWNQVADSTVGVATAVRSTVTATTHVTNELQELSTEGKECIQQLQSAKQGRQEGNDDGVVLPVEQTNKRQALTLQERYEQDKKQAFGTSTAENKAVLALLKADKSKP